MSINPLLLPISKDADTKRKAVLTNVMKMLQYRNWINMENLETNISSAIDLHTDDDIYKVNLDVNLAVVEFYDDIQNGDGTILMIKLIHQKVTGINKSPAITDFLTNYKKYHKILVVDDMPSTKILQQLNSTPNTESFFESFFLINLVEHECSPRYYVMSKKEQEDFNKEYQASKNKLCKIYDSDPASRYLYLKKGQIIRIERASEITGSSVGYRVVVHKNNNKNNIS